MPEFDGFWEVMVDRMPFRSQKQRRYMFAKHPTIAKRWVKEAKRKGQPIVQPKRKRRKKK